MILNPIYFPAAPAAPVTPAAPPLLVVPLCQHLSPMKLTQATPPHQVRPRPSLSTSPWRLLLLLRAAWRHTRLSVPLRRWPPRWPSTSEMQMLTALKSQSPRTRIFPTRLLLWPLSPGRRPLSLRLHLALSSPFLLELHLPQCNSST